MHTRLIPLTDDRGRLMLAEDPKNEPSHGSVVLTNGEYGTAWQRFFSDGRWHRVGTGKGRSWEQMLAERNLVLVYEAPIREGGESR